MGRSAKIRHRRRWRAWRTHDGLTRKEARKFWADMARRDAELEKMRVATKALARFADEQRRGTHPGTFLVPSALLGACITECP